MCLRCQEVPEVGLCINLGLEPKEHINQRVGEGPEEYFDREKRRNKLVGKCQEGVRKMRQRGTSHGSYLWFVWEEGGE